MLTQKEALKILNCDKSTLSRYVKADRVQRHKKGRNSFYDDREIALLAKEINDNKEKVGIDTDVVVAPQDEDAKEIQADYEKFHTLTHIGAEALTTATVDLKRLGLFDESDKRDIFMYAWHWQMTSHFASLMLEFDAIATSDGGTQTLHPYHRAMQFHDKQYAAYSDKLGFNPKSRSKMEIKKQKETTDMESLLNG